MSETYALSDNDSISLQIEAAVLEACAPIEQENEKLKADVARLRDVMRSGLLYIEDLQKQCGIIACSTTGEVREAISATASSDAWLNEQKVKVLEEAAKKFDSGDWFARDELQRIAEELREEKQK